jgi:hypothetical protein
VPASVRVPAGASRATFIGTASRSFTGPVKVWASGPDGGGPAATLQVGR